MKPFKEVEYISLIPASHIYLHNTSKVSMSHILNHLNQGSFDHVKVGPTPVLELHNLLRQIHMFLDIVEFRVEN